MPGVKGRSGGRNAKTVEQHRREGTFDPTRHQGYENPTPPVGTPVSPCPLEGEALAEWNRMVARLTTSGTLSVVDDAAIYQSAQLFAETEHRAARLVSVEDGIERLHAKLDDLEGAALASAIGNLSKLYLIELKYATQIRQGRMAQRAYLVEFGLTPAARGRVKLPDTPKDEDSFTAFQKTGTPTLTRVK